MPIGKCARSDISFLDDNEVRRGWFYPKIDVFHPHPRSFMSSQGVLITFAHVFSRHRPREQRRSVKGRHYEIAATHLN